MKPDLFINVSDDETIQNSFNKIAEDLILNWGIRAGDTLFHFTEVECYFKSNNHLDSSTHSHEVTAGRWRPHMAGIDISLGYGGDGYGGILIRGIKSSKEFYNGPFTVLIKLFEKVANSNPSEMGLTLEYAPQNVLLIQRSARYALGKTVNEKFKKRAYRFFTDASNWDKKYAKRISKYFDQN